MTPSRVYTSPPPTTTVMLTSSPTPGSPTPGSPTAEEVLDDELSTGAVVGIILGALAGMLIFVALPVVGYMWLVAVLYVSVHT